MIKIKRTKLTLNSLLIALLLLSGGKAFGQIQIQRAEWFVDQDPGFNMATPVSNLSPASEVDFNLSLDINNYGPGLHRFHIRTLDDAGTWSQTLSQAFYVLSRDSASELSYLEWFWDIDPGFGEAYPVPNVSGDTLDSSWAVDLDTLSPGIHNLYVRIQDEEGLWSQSLETGQIRLKVDNENLTICRQNLLCE